MFVIILFFLFYMVAVFLETKGGKNRDAVLVLACIVLAIVAGFRDVYFCYKFYGAYTNYR